MTFSHVMKIDKNTREASETCSGVTTSDLKTIWNVHMNLYEKTQFFYHKMTRNELSGQVTQSESSNGVETNRESIENYYDQYSGWWILCRFDVWKLWPKGSRELIREEGWFASLAPPRAREESASHHSFFGPRNNPKRALGPSDPVRIKQWGQNQSKEHQQSL